MFYWQDICHQPVYYVSPFAIRLDQTVLQNSLTIFDKHIGTFDIWSLTSALARYAGMQPQYIVSPQLAALIYDITKQPQVMSMYFPIMKKMDVSERQKFEKTIVDLIENPNFVLSVWDINQVNFTQYAPPSIAYIVAGHIVELLFYRQDLLTKFFANPRYFNIYMSWPAYVQSGGVAGGCYDPQSESIKLAASRLYEGFYGDVPGVAPLIHEFGHMLDSFYPSTEKMGKARGLFPGMLVEDGVLFTPEARQKFIQGKRLELDRYERARFTKPINSKDIPIGHPYVFQNDGEFLAGYLEMFFRNPNRFSELNPDLYEGFSSLFNQNPCDYWENDFVFYIEGNEKVYLENREGIHPAGLHVLA